MKRTAEPEKPEVEEDDKGRDYTADGLRTALEELGKIVADIESSAETMARPPAVLSVARVPYESSRKNGIKRLRAWADGLRDAVYAQKLALANESGEPVHAVGRGRGGGGAPHG